MNNPCGCLTYEQCWAGDCCCSTIAEKLKWARENDITPPESALRFAQTVDDADQPECPNCVVKTKKKSCCSEEATSSATSCCEKPASKARSRAFQFVVGSFAYKCKGHAFASAGLLPISVEPPKPFVVVTEHTTNQRIALIDRIPTSLANPPDAPPPRF